MGSANPLKPFLDFASENSPDNLEEMALVMELMRGPRLLMGHATGPVQVQTVHLYEKENAQSNHTAPYKAVYGEFPSCILRRGNLFKVGVRFNQVIEPGSLDCKITLSLGTNPATEDGTLVILTVPKTIQDEASAHMSAKDWSISIDLHHKDMLLLKIRSTANTPVGRWTMGLMLGNEPMYVVDKRIYILFNPWLKEDAVYLEDDQEREFYTMKDTGSYFYGSHTSYGHKKWFYGQFEKVNLATIEFLLKESKLTSCQRNDHVLLVRALGAMVNLQDDQGILYGKWQGGFDGGTHPSAWSSSTPILTKFMEAGGNNVKYGQCFVFGAVLTTILRSLGIPSRTITNFPSAHVETGDMTVDFYYDANNRFISGHDMEWNFHVWTECWMTRPDLPSGYDGWQVIDGTPQVMSGGKYQAGPFPVKAVLRDQVNLNYDGMYITAQVKATYKYHKQDPSQPNGYKVLGVEENRAGRVIVTEKLNLEDDTIFPEDITHTYKGRRPRARLHTESVIYVELEHAKAVPAGKPIVVLYRVINNDTEAHDVALTMSASSVTYNNKEPMVLATKSHKLNLSRGAQENFELNISPEAYVGELHSGGMILLEAVATFGEELSNARDIVTVEMPTIDLKVGKNKVPADELHYELTMRNPLRVALTKCEMSIELPATTKFLEKTKIKDILPGELFQKKGVLFITSQDTNRIVVTFMSKELPLVTNSKEF